MVHLCLSSTMVGPHSGQNPAWGGLSVTGISPMRSNCSVLQSTQYQRSMRSSIFNFDPLTATSHVLVDSIIARLSQRVESTVGEKACNRFEVTGAVPDLADDQIANAALGADIEF